MNKKQAELIEDALQLLLKLSNKPMIFMYLPEVKEIAAKIHTAYNLNPYREMRTIIVEQSHKKSVPDETQTEITKIKTVFGWRDLQPILLKSIDRIVYMGNCKQDGDCFIIYWGPYISFAKGKLNSAFFNINA